MSNSKSLIFHILFLTTVNIVPLRAQTYPQDFDYSRYTAILLDAGYLWDCNSTFHPLQPVLSISSPNSAFSGVNNYLADYASVERKQKHHAEKDLGLILLPGLGLSGQNGAALKYDHLAVQPMLWTSARFHDYYYRLLVRATNEVQSLDHYTGVARSIARAGLNTGEIDQSVLGYANDWATIEWGRTREIWGPAAVDNLLLSGYAPPYERLMLELRYWKLSYRWFYGFLEGRQDSLGNNVQRYIVGKALEFNNRRNFIFSIGEVSVFGGINRPPDWAFLNPLSVHLEIEQNDRENTPHENNSNFLLFANVDWLATPDLRLSGSFVLDEYQLDSGDRNQGTADALGWFGRATWTPVRNPLGVTLFAEGVRIGTLTIQHSYEFANLVTRDRLICHSIGNDADKITAGCRVVFNLPLVAEVAIGRLRWGDNSLLLNPYSHYAEFKRTPFPSGNVRENGFVEVSLLSMPVADFHVSIDSHFDISHSGPDSELEKHTFNLRYQKLFSWNGNRIKNKE